MQSDERRAGTGAVRICFKAVIKSGANAGPKFELVTSKMFCSNLINSEAFSFSLSLIFNSVFVFN
jgi:hypothetical protein